MLELGWPEQAMGWLGLGKSTLGLGLVVEDKPEFFRVSRGVLLYYAIQIGHFSS
jgi:hypothetical protein